LKNNEKTFLYQTLRNNTKSVAFCDGCQMSPLAILKKDYNEEYEYGALVE
jgi:hypothetical protein